MSVLVLSSWTWNSWWWWTSTGTSTEPWPRWDGEGPRLSDALGNAFMIVDTGFLPDPPPWVVLERARRGVDDALLLDLWDASPTTAGTSIDSLLIFKLSRFEVGSELDIATESPQDKTARHVNQKDNPNETVHRGAQSSQSRWLRRSKVQMDWWNQVQSIAKSKNERCSVEMKLKFQCTCVKLPLTMQWDNLKACGETIQLWHNNSSETPWACGWYCKCDLRAKEKDVQGNGSRQITIKVQWGIENVANLMKSKDNDGWWIVVVAKCQSSEKRSKQNAENSNCSIL